MTEETDKSSTAADASQEVDRIRDIIFGSNMREYDQRFQTVQRDMDRLQQTLDNLAEQLNKQDSGQNSKLQDLRKEMRQAEDDLRNELRETAQRLQDEKVDRTVLGELFIELGTNLKQGVSLADLLKNVGNSK